MRILDLGDTAFTVEFGDRIDPALQAQVNGFDAALRAAADAGRMPGLIEMVPTFRSLTVIVDPIIADRAAIQARVRECLDRAHTAEGAPSRRWRLPVIYGGADGPDLTAVAQVAGMEPEAVIERHTTQDYVVYMLGFLPGFPFMGDVPTELRLPRRTEPRVRVPAGSVAIANGMTAIYPWESPGGWHLLGRCPAPLFDASRTVPALLAAGDRVGFEAVGTEAMADIEADLAAGRLDPSAWQVSP